VIFFLPAARRVDATKRFQALEEGNERLGVCLLDTVTGEVGEFLF
jgi:beta-lactamase class A